jgi:uncharacterized protein (DUF2252 family)
MKSLRERIDEFNKVVPPLLLGRKYKRMSENAFSFFRGTCHLFYEDLAENNSFTASPVSWITGDLHLENFGSYKGDNRLVYFDLNDFNESILASLSWELSRMITSIFIAFDSLHIDHKEAKKVAGLFLKTYSSLLSAGKPRYIEERTTKGIVRDFLKKISRRNQNELLDGRVFKKGKNLRLTIDNERQLKPGKELKNKLNDFIGNWLENQLPQYQPMDIAFRIAGTGSVGVNRYVFLVKHLKKENKYLLLDMKEATTSCLAKFCPASQPEWTSEAGRMFAVQQYMQNNCPALLSTASFGDESFIIKELQPSEDKINFKLIKERNREISQVINDMAILTASAQLRSAGRKGAALPDELIAFGNSDQWQKEILEFSLEYSKKMKIYYHEFLELVSPEDFFRTQSHNVDSADF